MPRLRLLLNSGLSGPHAPFVLAQERGYFAAAGLEVEFVGGEGAAAVVPEIGRNGIDAGYGDLNALAALAAARPAPSSAGPPQEMQHPLGGPGEASTGGNSDTPLAVSVFFNATPFTIAVRADGPIQRAEDLAGHHLSGHARDAALLLFPALAGAAGVPVSGVRVSPSSLSLGAQVRDLLLAERSVDGVFGFVNTIIAAVTPLGVDPTALRFLRFADHLPDLYGNSLMVTRRLIAQAPEQVRGLVHALNRGLVDTVADSRAGIDALLRAEPAIQPAVQHRRLLGTLAEEMAHPEGARIGIGDVDDARLARGLAQVARSCGWTRTPAVDEVFTRAFLPPLAERVRSLAR